jgi:hypothetical protein
MIIQIGLITYKKIEFKLNKINLHYKYEYEENNF